MQRGHQDHRPNPERHDRMIQEHNHDPYKRREKMADPAICPTCGAVYEDGRWRWGLLPTAATPIVCQACERIADHCPAGVVTLTGRYAAEHGQELLALVRHQEEQEKAEHPLNRIMEIRSIADGFEVTTTDIHLPRRIGEALRRTRHGDLTLHYDKGECFARVRWHAD